MQKHLDAATFFALNILFASITTACNLPGGSFAASDTKPPKQVGLEEYGADQERTISAFNELASLRNSIQEARDQWRHAPTLVGPEFDREADALAKEIRSRCEVLERQATSLLAEPFIRNHKGETDRVNEYLEFARAARVEIEGEKGNSQHVSMRSFSFLLKLLGTEPRAKLSLWEILVSTRAVCWRHSRADDFLVLVG